MIDARIMFHLGKDPSTLSDEEWAHYAHALDNIFKEEAKRNGLEPK